MNHLNLLSWITQSNNIVINWKEACVLATENNQGAQHIKEAIHISKTAKTSLTVHNKHMGFHKCNLWVHIESLSSLDGLIVSSRCYEGVPPTFMLIFLEQALATAPLELQTAVMETLCGRHLEIIKSDQVDNITVHLNQRDPTDIIKLTYEQTQECSIPFLDTLIIRKLDGSFKPLLYRKSTHTNLNTPISDLNFSSHHSIHHKLRRGPHTVG